MYVYPQISIRSGFNLVLIVCVNIVSTFKILLCGVALNICQKHVHGLPDLPHSDYSLKNLYNFHHKITTLSLIIPVQWLVTFLEIFDQIWLTFSMKTVD